MSKLLRSIVNQTGSLKHEKSVNLRRLPRFVVNTLAYQQHFLATEPNIYKNEGAGSRLIEETLLSLVLLIRNQKK